MFIAPLKYIWRNLGLRTTYLDYRYRSLLKAWRTSRDGTPWPCDKSEPVVLLIPSDPALLLASKGDEAMLTAIISHFQGRWPDVHFIVATESDAADTCACELGIEPLRALDESLSLQQSIDLMKHKNICASVTVGADVLDGSYSPVFSAKLLMLTDMLARRGVDCVITGFSVSKTPYKELKLLLDEFSDRVVFNLRDPLSFARFKQLTSASANLVADVAFLLQPQHGSKAVRATRNWVEKQHALARTVIGLNLHPLLLELEERQNIGQVVQNFSHVIRQLIQEDAISVVLLEHDFRGTSADHHCLNLVEQQLGEDLASYVFKPEARLSAAELKGVAEYMDGVVSGRMHLMIASCGAGTPVFGIEYKGKMEGLMKHFGLDTRNLSSAHEIIQNPDAFASKLVQFIHTLSTTRQQMIVKLPEIKRLSSMNFSNLPACNTQ